MRVVHIDFAGEFKPGDPRPTGYCDVYEWAEVQMKAGLKQIRCGVCGLWNFPQELSGKTIATTGETAGGVPLTLTSPVCNGCDNKGCDKA